MMQKAYEDEKAVGDKKVDHPEKLKSNKENKQAEKF